MFGYVQTLSLFLAYFALGLALLAAFAGVYAAVTPHKEMALIRDGNGAAAIGYLGAIFGFSLPLASAAANSVTLVDFAVWAVIAMVVQILAFFVARATMDDLSGRIARGEVAGGAWAGGIAVAVGLLNAACMTY